MRGEAGRARAEAGAGSGKRGGADRLRRHGMSRPRKERIQVAYPGIDQTDRKAGSRDRQVAEAEGEQANPRAWESAAKLKTDMVI